MSNRTKYVLGGAGLVIIAWWLLPSWMTTMFVLAVVAAPIIGYLVLDEGQRRRLSQLRRRGQLRR